MTTSSSSSSDDDEDFTAFVSEVSFQKEETILEKWVAWFIFKLSVSLVIGLWYVFVIDNKELGGTFSNFVLYVISFLIVIERLIGNEKVVRDYTVKAGNWKHSVLVQICF